MDKIRIDDLEIFANHGVYPEENKLGQKFLISCELEVDTREAGKTDELEYSIDYGTICHMIKRVMEENTFKLLESCVEHIAEEILKYINLVESVKVTIKKPWAPIGLPLDTASVTIERRWHEAYIALGSNLGDSRKLIEEALKKLDHMDDCMVEHISTLIETEPYGGIDQPNFLNGAAKVKTLKKPFELLDCLHELEKEAGRERKVHWGPRTLDLDILFYDDLIIEEADLCIPHIDMKNRRFVLEPMAEIAPYKLHPVYNKRVIELFEELKSR